MQSTWATGRLLGGIGEEVLGLGGLTRWGLGVGVALGCFAATTESKKLRAASTSLSSETSGASATACHGATVSVDWINARSTGKETMLPLRSVIKD